MSSRQLAPLGELAWDAAMRWWQSRSVPVGLFGGEPMSFLLRTDLDRDGAWPADVGVAIQKFLALDLGSRIAMRERIYAHYQRVAARDPGAPRLQLATIWSHIEPGGEISVTRHAENGAVYVVLECGCDWDPEHGLQLVLRDGALTRASAYDEQLTDPVAVTAAATMKAKPTKTKR